MSETLSKITDCPFRLQECRPSYAAVFEGLSGSPGLRAIRVSSVLRDLTTCTSIFAFGAFANSRQRYGMSNRMFLMIDDCTNLDEEFMEPWLSSVDLSLKMAGLTSLCDFAILRFCKEFTLHLTFYLVAFIYAFTSSDDKGRKPCDGMVSIRLGLFSWKYPGFASRGGVSKIITRCLQRCFGKHCTQVRST